MQKFIFRGGSVRLNRYSPNLKRVPRIGITCNQLGSDGRPKRDPVEKEPIRGHSVLNQVRRPPCGRTDAVDFIAD
jgi:hypothetical protein